MTKQELEQIARITLEEKEGKLYRGYLDLRGTQITSLPDNLTVGGSLDLRGTQITSLPDNLTVGGSLYLRGTQITSLPDNLTVGGSLYLRGTQITSLPDNLTVGGSLDLRGTQITSLPDNLTVGGSLELEGTQITSLPDNLTVGGSLDLEGTQITSLPDNLTVGGSLYLRGTQITSLPDNITVGGSLYLRGTQITDLSMVKKDVSFLSWKKNGKEYIKCDDRFSEVVSKRKNIWELKDLNKENRYFLITDGNGSYSHGNIIKEAKEDLIFKLSDRDKSEYADLDTNMKFNFKFCIEMYHNITGACLVGIKNFIERKGIAKTENFTISEMAKITKGNYGNDEFCTFFNIK